MCVLHFFSQRFCFNRLITALFSDDAFDYDYEGGVHTAQVTGNLTVADVNHDVEVGHTRTYQSGVSLYSLALDMEHRRKTPLSLLFH